MKNRAPQQTAPVLLFPNDAAQERADAIEHEMLEMKNILTLMEAVVDGERNTCARDFLVRSLTAHHAHLDALLFPQQ
jgi:hypothetical protein